MPASGLPLPPTAHATFDAVRWFGRHFLHFQCDFSHPQTQPVPIPWGIGGFVVSHWDEWFVVTAGHCLKEVERALVQGGAFTSWHMDDAAGADASHNRIGPFAFDAAAKGGYFDEELGADYGLIHVRWLYRNIAKSNGVVPLDCEAWPTWRVSFESFWLLGIPLETIHSGPTHEMTYKQLRLAEMRACQDDEIPTTMHKPFPRHFFKPVSGFEDLGKTLNSPVGMSGGPVFGLRTVRGVRRYWLVGIQSTWDKRTHTFAVSTVDARLSRCLSLCVADLRSTT